MTQGAIYAAFGEPFVREAIVSASSLRRAMPDLPVTLFTNAPPSRTDLFHRVVQVAAERPLLEKLRCLNRSPYETTLFLDTDTFVLENVSELFELLDRFDLAATHDRGYTDWFPPQARVPESFREFNTGVVAYRQSDRTAKFLGDCESWYRDLSSLPGPRFRGEFPDQPAFRAAAFHGDLRIATLTFEYNCRFPYFGYASGKIKILHGREFLTEFGEPELARAARALNAVDRPRVYVAGDVIALSAARSPFSRRYVPRMAGHCLPSNWRRLLSRARKKLRLS